MINWTKHGLNITDRNNIGYFSTNKISVQTSLWILMEILLGPELLEEDKEFINFDTSPGAIGNRKI